ncbi:MAG: chromosomal replication initiator protein DnaA [Microcystis wesenbergii Mw_MB_S_20031200_S109]|uniref:Chromosomal replication initiator protein DnaA n=1 Tax=Microcystis wesenbergii Mw_MB_S_20031200_S109D TaxID=2486241 RepID=A0A552M774_9CHRO|nr:MAG: chromosomal replication initiator protein DnaA [Microcystis wesenbergii Mw_MB_S_20031200_S109]TRV28302.1 MAG: chromosomal replication initiator protein DnaA [Microcystis wesenbergii Mw_MB_S_20031200_S109D]
MDSSAQQLWHNLLERLKLLLTRPAFETWFQTATVKEWQNDRLVIQAANPFILNHLQKNYLSTIAEVVEDIVGYPVEIQLTAQQGDSITIFQPNTSLESELPPSNQLNPKYNFSRFVVGPTNRMAHAAALAVAELPGREFNPLFLCGGVGLGKTHLMQAIGHYRLELYPQSRVFYVSTEQFTNDLITAIRQDSMESFRNHYRHADILLVDDLQFIEGKEYTQEEFFHTFNTLHEAGKQVVLASDRLPKQIPSLQDRLISRFSMGLVADIQAPDIETRMAILQKKAEYENLRLPREVIEYIAVNYTSNIRELEGALIRATTYISISGLPMTVENIAPVLNPPMAKIATSPEIIMAVVAEKFQLSIADLKGNSRRREISFARQIGMYLMRQHTDLSLPRIGEEFGGKDHTTVIYSCDKINLSQHQDRQLQEILAQLIERINSLSRNQ